MSKSVKLAVCVVMAAALALMAVLAFQYLDMKKELNALERQLNESRDNWEKIAADKEELQVGLKAKQKEINKTQLQLEEAEERALELKQDILLLQQEIEALKE